MKHTQTSHRPLQTETRSDDLALLDQQLALGAYFQALLQPPAPPAPSTVATPPEPVPTATVTAPVVSTPPVIAPPVIAPPVTAPPVTAPPVTAPPVTAPPLVEPAVSAALPTPAVAPSAPYPEWAQGPFQCLLFRVAGLALAVPLTKLQGVLPWDDQQVTPMPNHQPWFLGLRPHLGHKVKLIDVANVVLPAAHYAERVAAEANCLGNVILIDSGHWGLAVDEVAEVISLTPEAVKWRSQAGSRPWLAGTVIKEMCALIDTDAFAAMLQTCGPSGQAPR